MSLSAKKIRRDGASAKLSRKLQKDLSLFPWLKSRPASKKARGANIRTFKKLKRSGRSKGFGGLW